MKVFLNHKSENRPKVFDLKRSGDKDRFDEKKLGLLVNRDLNSKSYKKLAKKAKRGNRSIYDTSRDGHMSIGHEFNFYKEMDEEIKKNLIEYLKTL